MKYEYKLKEIPLSNTNKFLSIQLPKEISLIETFLTSDVQSHTGGGEWVLGAINKVLSGELEHAEITGNVCTLEIAKEKTRVLDSLADDGVGNTCEIETSELKELVEIWLDEKGKFDANLRNA